MTTTQTQALRQLEDEFAEAMQRMYAVGNGLARVRAQVEREGTAPSATVAAGPSAPGASAPAASAPAWSGPARPAAAGPGAGGLRPVVQPFPGPGGVPSVPGGVPSVPGGVPSVPGGVPSVPGGAAQAARPAAPPMPPAPTGRPGIPMPMPPTPPVPAVRWWQREGMVTRVLAVTGAVVTLAGVAMLLVLAMQHGWFGPVPRVVSGALLAVGLIGVAHWVRARQAREPRPGSPSNAGPVAIAATGYAAAYLDIVAVTTIYDWVPAVPGLLAAALVAATGLLLARRWDSQLLAVITVTGSAVLAPFVAGELSWVLIGFLVMLSVATWPAQLDRTWPALTGARILPAVLAIMAGAATFRAGGTDSLVTVVLAALLAVVTLASSTYAVRRSGDDVTATVAVALTGVAALAALAPQERPLRVGGLVLLGAAQLLAFAVTSRRPLGPVATHLAVAFGASGTLSLVVAAVSGAPDHYEGTSLLLLALVYAAAAGTMRSRPVLGLASAVGALALLGGMQHVPPTVDAGIGAGHRTGVAIVDSALAAALIATTLWAFAMVPGTDALRPVVRLVAWVAGLAVTVVGPVAVGVLVGTRIGDPRAGFIAGHAVATISWMLGSAWLLGRGLRRAKDSELELRMGLLLAGVSVAKLFLFDLAALDGIWRVVAFIVTGLLLLATGTGYAKALERSRRGRPQPVMPGGTRP